MSLVVALLLLTFPAAVISAQEEPFALPIVGGQPSSVGDYPFLVAIVTDGGYRWNPFCGGSILNEHYIVTAAHCFYNRGSPVPSSEWKKWSVVAGVNDLSSKKSGQVTSFSDVTIHPNYNPSTMANDFAKAKLTSPLALQAGQVAKAEFNTDTSCPISGETCTVTGWGNTQAEGSPSNVRLKCDLRIYSLESCKEKSQLASNVHTSSICAGTETGGRDACQGDSGGPLICTCRDRLVVAGIVSCGRGCGRPDVPGIYTGVAYFQEYTNGAPSRMQSTVHATLPIVIASLMVSMLM